MSPAVTATTLEGLPEIAPGADLAELLGDALGPLAPVAGDILVLAHKAVSKAEGRLRRLSEVVPGPRAQVLAQQLGKDPRHVQVVLEQSIEILRAERGVLICVTPHGFVCANAGVDASNVPGEDAVLMLPEDPDASARELRAGLRARLGVDLGVIITDSFGRAWRHGQCDVTIGCAGLQPLADWRGRSDREGRELRATWIAVADELAAAADLARAKDGGQPAVLVRGAAAHVTPEDGPGVRALLRPRTEDLFR